MVPAFQKGTIPRRQTADGLDLSPAVELLDLPERARFLALILADPDAPGGEFLHWGVLCWPHTRRRLEEGFPRARIGPDGIRQLVNDYGWVGYGGPNPPEGSVHRYVLSAVALAERLDPSVVSTLPELRLALDRAALASAQLVATYGR